MCVASVEKSKFICWTVMSHERNIRISRAFVFFVDVGTQYFSGNRGCLIYLAIRWNFALGKYLYYVLRALG